MSVTIHSVRTRKDIRDFIQLPYKVYRGSEKTYTAWVPPLDIDIHHMLNKKKNPMYDHCEGEFWIAKENNTVVGRIAAFVDNDFIAFQKIQAGFFGFFESHNKQEVSKQLFMTAEQWLKSKGMEKSIGPVNGSTNYQLGNQIDSFDEMPVIEMPYSAPFYAELIENSGYTKLQDLYSYRQDVRENELNDKIRKISATAAKRNGVTIRTANMKNWDAEVATVKNIWEDAWSDNWGFTPWHEPEFREMAKNLKLIMHPKLTYIAEIDGEAVGFCFPIPDVNFAFHKINGKLFPSGIFHLLMAKKKAKSLRVAAFGVLKKFHNKAIDGIMIARLYDDGKYEGFDIGEFSWILETNYPLRNLLERMGSEHYRTHRVYEKQLPSQ